MKHKRSLLSIAMATFVLVSLCAVCVSSTSVTAAEGSTPLVQASGALIVGCPVGSAPATSYQDVNTFNLFVRGEDGALWWRQLQSTTGWSSWTSLGGYLTSDPAAVSGYADGRTDVFVRGADGALWSTYTTNRGTSWSNWYKIGGQLLAGTGPTAYAWANTRIGVFVTGTNHELWHNWSDAAGRHAWQSLGGYLTSSPAATALTTGTVAVFARGADGGLWGRATADGGTSWNLWQNIGGQIAPGTAPATCSWSTRGDVFVKGMNGELWHRWYVSGWSNWESLGGHLTSSPAAASRAPGDIVVLVRGGHDGLWGRATENGGTSWTDWTSIGAI
jgi:hypothetical protein